MPHDTTLHTILRATLGIVVDDWWNTSIFFPALEPCRFKHGRASEPHIDGRADRSYGENQNQEGHRPAYPT